MTIKQIQKLIEEGETLETLTQAYADISSIRLRRIKSQVQRNRKFFEEIALIMSIVKRVATRSNITLSKNGKTITLILTSNEAFHGRINDKLIDFFTENISSQNTDLLVVGQTGQDYLKFIQTNQTFTPFTFSDDLPQPLEFIQLVDKIKNYSQILVIYPYLKTLLIQSPTLADITQTAQQIKPSLEKPNTFIFEPELKTILHFFDTQVTSILLEQAFLEAELSRIAARLLSMNQARLNAQDFTKGERMKLYSAKKSLENSKILERVFALQSIKIQHGR